MHTKKRTRNSTDAIFFEAMLPFISKKAPVCFTIGVEASVAENSIKITSGLR